MSDPKDAAELMQEAEQEYQQKREEQEEFLSTVAEEEGQETLETECNIVGDYVVPIRAKLNGELMDQLGEMDARLERLEAEEGRAYEFGEAADRASQVLADAIDDKDWHKSKFYAVYEEEGIQPLGVMLRRVFESLKTERERRQGAAEGFRAT